MAKFIVDLHLDGYENEEEMEEACIEFMNENLDFSASSVSVEKFDEKKFQDMEKQHNIDEGIISKLWLYADSLDLTGGNGQGIRDILSGIGAK